MDRPPLVELPARLLARQARCEGRYLLGVDGGATKTLAAVLDLDGGGVCLGHAGPSNEDAVGARDAVAALLAAADEALRGAGAEQGQLAGAVLAVAGTNTDAIAGQVGAERPASWLVVNDVVGAWATATGAGPGVGAIAGTGSNVFGVGPDGRGWRVGGWGHLLGDEGSGYWLGLQSIRAALRDRDGSGPPTALTDRAGAFFEVPSVEALASWVYTKPLTKGEIAAFAVETARAAGDGDAVARALFEGGARELAAQVGTVVTRTGLSGEFPVGLIGSAYKAGPVFLGPLEREIHAHAPQARIATVEMAPVGGSLLLAARACGRQDELEPGALAASLDAATDASRL